MTATAHTTPSTLSDQLGGRRALGRLHHWQRVDGVKINTLRAAGAANLARRAC